MPAVPVNGFYPFPYNAVPAGYAPFYPVSPHAYPVTPYMTDAASAAAAPVYPYMSPYSFMPAQQHALRSRMHSQQNGRHAQSLNSANMNGPNNGSQLPDASCLFVCHLPPTVDDAALAALFAPYGALLACKVMMDHSTGQSRGYGFVNMATVAEAGAACNALNGVQMQGKFLRVAFKTARQEHQTGRHKQEQTAAANAENTTQDTAQNTSQQNGATNEQQTDGNATTAQAAS